MDDASGHEPHKDGPSTDLGRALSDVLNAAPQFVATLQSKPHDDHKHGEHGHDDDGLDPSLTKLIDEIRTGLKEMRNPAGVVANCNDALKRLCAAFGDFNGKPLRARDPGRPYNHMLGVVLLALAAVAIGFILVGGHTDVTYPPVSDPDYRQLAYPAAVDAPNLGTWLSWIVLGLAAVGAAIWTMGRMPDGSSRPAGGDNAGLRRLYERGLISGDLYDRGRWLAPDDLLQRQSSSENYAREYGAYVLALADALRHRRRLGAAASYRDARDGALSAPLFGGPAKTTEF